MDLVMWMVVQKFFWLLVLNLAPTSLALLYGDLQMALNILEMGHCSRNSTVHWNLKITPKRYARTLGFVRDYASILSHLFDKNFSVGCAAGLPLNSSCKCFQDFEGSQCQNYKGNCTQFECSASQCGFTLEEAIDSVKCTCQQTSNRSRKDISLKKDAVINHENEINIIRATNHTSKSKQLVQNSHKKKKKDHSSKDKPISSHRLSLNDALRMLRNRDSNLLVKLLSHTSHPLPRPRSHSPQAPRKASDHAYILPAKNPRHRPISTISSEDADINIIPVKNAITLAPCIGMMCKYFIVELKSPKFRDKDFHVENVLKRQDKLNKISPYLQKILGALQNDATTVAGYHHLVETLPESYEEIINGVPENFTVCPLTSKVSTTGKTKSTSEDTFITIDIIEGVIEDNTTTTAIAAKPGVIPTSPVAINKPSTTTFLPKLISAQDLNVTKISPISVASTELVRVNISSKTDVTMKVTILPQEFSRAELILGTLITTTGITESKLRWPPEIEAVFKANASPLPVLPKGVKFTASHENVLARLVTKPDDTKVKKNFPTEKYNKFEEPLRKHNIAVFKTKSSSEKNNESNEADLPLMGSALDSIWEGVRAKVAARDDLTTSVAPVPRRCDVWRRPTPRRLANRRHHFSMGKRKSRLDT